MSHYITKSQWSKLSNVTKKVIGDYNKLSDMEFMRKYCCTKATYLKRVKRYRDPYMYAPLAIIGKAIKRLSK